MGTTGGSGAAKRTAPPTPAVVGTARSMRARDVSRPRQSVVRRPVLPETETDEQDDQGKGGSSPVDS
ncbi:hypothetical protein [Kribbella sp. HUAS MG21]|uniref:Uncharacterized protein n=1 Tax=Kribbella sp. HUAS MG21 TaxID=3160966 RepID=A0AAU7TE30_9ACTN